MTIRVFESAGGREGTGSDQVTIDFICLGTDSEQDAVTATRDHLSVANADLVTYDGKNLTGLSISERLGPNAFKVSAEYTPPSPGDYGTNQTNLTQVNGGSWTFSFDATGRNSLRLVSLKTVAAYGWEDAKKQKVAAVNSWLGLLDVAPESKEPQGFEVPVPVLTATLNLTLPYASINPTWMITVAELIGKTNKEDIGAFKAGQLLFTGVQGSQAMEGDVTIGYQFVIETTEVITNLPNDIPDVTLPPHHLMWFHRVPTIWRDKRLYAPVAAAVEQVYETGDFSVLGL